MTQLDGMPTTTDTSASTDERDFMIGFGRRAEQLRRADLAAHLSDLASVTATLFEVVAERGTFDPRLAPLTRQAQAFANRVRGLEHATERHRTYRELVPSQLWSEAVQALTIDPGLADRIAEQLASIQAGDCNVSLLSQVAERLEAIAATFQRIGRRDLESAMERASAEI